MFTRSVVHWSQQAILTATDAAPEQFFGFAAAIGGGNIVLGTPFHDASAGLDAGPAYAFSPSQFFAAIWVGLKNNDDVGLRLDLKVTAVVGGTPVEGQINNVSSGGAGFNNAILQAVALGLTGLVSPSQVTVSARVSCSRIGHATGTARLWYNGRPIDAGPARSAGSRVERLFGESFLRDDGSAAHVMPEHFLSPMFGTAVFVVDLPLTDAISCQAPSVRPFTPFATWSVP